MTGFEYEVLIDADAERVWHALRDRAQIRRWHGWHYEGLDEEIEVIYFGKVTESGHTLNLGTDTFTLTAHNGGTLLRLQRAPIGTNPQWDAYYEDVNEGWTTFLQQLRFALERHPGEDRLTVFVSREGSAEKVAEVFNLLRDKQIGDDYEVSLANGERLAGQVWFRSAHQLGLTVQGWGDGLLVAGEVPKSQQHREGGEMMVLTGYDADAFADMEKRWQF